jgi:hypothetical protein
MQAKPNRRPRRLPSYSAVTSTLALIFAFAAFCVGGAYATGVLVTSKQIKNGSILTQDIHKNAVTDKSIGSNAVTSTDIKDDAVGADDIGAGQVDSEAIGTGQVSSSDIGNGQVTPQDVTMPDPEQIKVSDIAKIEPASLEFQKLDDVGSYTKEDPSSALQVEWTGSVEGHNAGEASGCVFQLRVDGQPPQGGGGEVFGTGIVSVSDSALFGGFGAGSHSIEIWAKLARFEPSDGPALNNCTVGPAAAGINQTVVISEQVI